MVVVVVEGDEVVDVELLLVDVVDGEEVVEEVVVAGLLVVGLERVLPPPPLIHPLATTLKTKTPTKSRVIKPFFIFIPPALVLGDTVSSSVIYIPCASLPLYGSMYSSVPWGVLLGVRLKMRNEVGATRLGSMCSPYSPGGTTSTALFERFIATRTRSGVHTLS